VIAATEECGLAKALVLPSSNSQAVDTCHHASRQHFLDNVGLKSKLASFRKQSRRQLVKVFALPGFEGAHLPRRRSRRKFDTDGFKCAPYYLESCPSERTG